MSSRPIKKWMRKQILAERDRCANIISNMQQKEHGASMAKRQRDPVTAEWHGHAAAILTDVYQQVKDQSEVLA